MERAVAFHQNGQLQQAQELYEGAVALQPGNSAAWQLLGTIALQTRNPRKALECLNRAIEIEPGDATAHCNRGLALQQLKSPDAARSDYERAVALDPRHSWAHCYLGNLLQEIGDFDRALLSYERAIEIQPKFAEAYTNRGLVLKHLDRLDDALSSFDLAISIQGDLAEAHSNRGLVLCRLDRLDDALASLDRAIALKPEYANAHTNRGLVFASLNRFGEALASHNRAISLRPDLAEAYSNRAAVLARLRRFEDALADYDRAIAIRPDFAEAYSNSGLVLVNLNRLDEGLARHNRAVSLKPARAEAYSNRGLALADLDRLPEALADYDRALVIKPDFAEAYSNRGLVLARLDKPDDALASYDRAIELQGDFAAAHYNRSLTSLLSGDFENGWVDFEWRWKLPNVSAGGSRRFDQPLWLGKESIAGKSILLHSEQGLGDTLQFCRYAKLVSDSGARVILEVDRGLEELLATLDGVAQVVVKGAALPSFDYQCPLMSLPLAFKTTLLDIPAAVPYLKSDPGKRRFWGEKVGAGRTFRVGLVWSGGYRANQPEVWAANSRRNIPLAKLAPLVHPHIEFYSLQKGNPAESELAQLATADWAGPRIIDFTNLLHDFSDTAALIENLDLVISVDTSTAHLAGALGRPVWIMNRFDTCWRWLAARADSPWYPTATIYRQDAAGDWDGVVERVSNSLARLVGDRG